LKPFKVVLIISLLVGFNSLFGQLSLKQDQLFRNDSVFDQDDERAFQTKYKSLEPSENALLFIGQDSFKLEVNPALDLALGALPNEEEWYNQYGVGLQLNITFKRFSLGFTYLNYSTDLLPYQKEYIEQRKVYPSSGVVLGNSFASFNYLESFLHYKSERFFDFEVGYGRNFIGDGYRSLLLSDFGQASPYAMLQASFWHIQYTTLFSMHRDIRGVESSADLFRQKYTATHFLEWKIAPWIRVGVFESIVWAADDGQYHRGFDVNYLNPVIFYRPVEFSVGSSDNALLGANLAIEPTSSQKFYFQLLFDEFLLDELRADLNQWRNPDQDIQSGWWANKYGIQSGWTGLNDFGIKGLSHLVEFNLVRPYTYAHSNPTQAYSNYNQSLAHPLGANFHEFVGRLTYSRKKVSFNVQYNNQLRGISETGTNFGDDLELSNQDRDKEYENYVGQGLTSRVQVLDLSFSYLLKPEWDLSLSVGHFSRNEVRAGATLEDNMTYIRLRTNLFNRYFDF